MRNWSRKTKGMLGAILMIVLALGLTYYYFGVNQNDQKLVEHVEGDHMTDEQSEAVDGGDGEMNGDGVANGDAAEPEEGYEEVPFGLDITNQENLVAIHYSSWFNPVVGPGKPTYNMNQILTQSGMDKAEPRWGPLHAFHFWGEPELGYYRSDDVEVIRTHMRQLHEAGVDFLIFDNTNARSTWGSYYDDIFREPAGVFLDTVLEMRANGEPTPYLLYWAGSWANDNDPTFAGMGIYKDFYNEQYQDLFVYYQGKPLLLVTDLIPDELMDVFTVRKMWGLQGSLPEEQWSFLQAYPQNVAMSSSGEPEQVTVTAAMQRDYLSNFATATPKRGGVTFYEQWKTAFEVRPKVVTITWWNEWIMQRFEDEQGRTRFVDGYSDEYSRDIEPQAGGSGDAYFEYMKGYIAAYKAGDAVPPLGLVHDEVMLGDFEIGHEGWRAGNNVARAVVRFSEEESDVPEAYHAYRLFEAVSREVAADEWRVLFRTFEQTVEFSQHASIRFAFYGDVDAPGASGYEVWIRLRAGNQEELEVVVSYDGDGDGTGSGWQVVELDMADWPFRDQVKQMQIGYRAVGSQADWEAKFYVDLVQAVK